MASNVESKMFRCPFICVEGIDGVGKSVVTQKLAKAVGGIYYKTPPAPYEAIRAKIDREADHISRFLFYLSAVAFASTEISRLCLKRPVVCDRYIYSTFAYHTVLDERLRNHPFPEGLVMPDYAILLVANEVERIERLNSRSDDSLIYDRRMQDDAAFLALVEHEFRNFGLQIIDTTGIDADKVVDRALTLVGTAKSGS